jgi:CheY-like chemotaxis protein
MNFLKNSPAKVVTPKRVKILVIEDDPSLIEVLQSLFEIYNYDYHIYQDAQDIKSLVFVHQPDVVLLDYLLPTTNGGNLCLQLKYDEGTADVPVIIYSAISKQLLPINEYRCDYFIEKPFDLDFLIQKINQYCSTIRSHKYSAQ